MQYIVPGICGLLIILGLVGVVMSRTIWRVPQLIVVGLILVSSTLFLWMTARTLQTQWNWQREINEYHQQIDVTEKGIQSTEKGNPQPKLEGIEQLHKDIVCLNRELTVALAGRGRVWHNVARVGQFDPATQKFIGRLDDNSPAGIEPKMLLYAFDESDREKGGQYLGEFVVTAVKDTRIEMVPAVKLLQSEANAIANSKGPWAFYEIMPSDDHTSLALNLPAVEADSSCQAVVEQTQIKLDANQLRALLPSNPENRKDPAFEAIYNEYARDGTPYQDNDPPDHVWWRVKFLKEYSAEDAAAPAAPQPNVPLGGAAAEAAAARSFKPGDTHLFDQPTAQDLIDKGIVELDKTAPDKGKVYVRPLRNYAQLFRAAYRQRDRLAADVEDLTTQQKKIADAAKSVYADIDAAKTEQADLKYDLDHVTAQLKVVTDFVSAIEARYKEEVVDEAGQKKLVRSGQVWDQIKLTFASNLALAAELDKLEHQLYDTISRRHPQGQASAPVKTPALP